MSDRVRRRAGAAVAIVALGLAVAVVLPALAGFDASLDRLRAADPGWLVLALVLETASYAGYVVLLHSVVAVHATGRAASWRTCAEIAMAGVAATRLLATAGAGGIALTAWALRRHGLPAHAVAVALATFFVSLYGVFFALMLLVGAGLALGALPGPSPSGLTVVPALLAAAVIGVALGSAAVAPAAGEVDDEDSPAGAVRRAARRLRTARATLGEGVRETLRLLSSRRHGFAGAVAWWGCDIAVLWACMQAFGDPPPLAVVVMAHVVGQLGNVLPLPGGVGGVEGGLIAALLGFGVATDLAVVAVLSYRTLAFWLPTVPGVLAFGVLRRDLPSGAGTTSSGL